MPELHRAGNPFASAPPPKTRPKHKAGNPFAAPEIDTFPELYPTPEKKKSVVTAAAQPSRFDPTWLSRKVAEVGPEAVKGAAEGVVQWTGKTAAGLVRQVSKMSPVVASGMLDPTDPQRKDALPKSELAETAAEDLAGNIRKVEKRLVAKIPKPASPTTGQKVARVAGNVAGQLAPFVAAGPLGLAAGSALNVASEVGADPEESLLGMFSKEHAKSPVKRGLAALAGDVAIGVPLLAGAQALKGRKVAQALRAKALRDSGLDADLTRAADAIPGAAPVPEAPALAPSGPPPYVSRAGAVGNQPPLPLKPSARGPVVDLKSYPLSASPSGTRRADAGVRYNRVTKGGRGELADQSWMDESPIKSEADLTDYVLTGQQRRLVDLANEVKDASPSGGFVINPGPKTARSTAQKISRMGPNARSDLSPLQQLGDLNRATVIVEHPSDAGPVIAKLQESGWLRELDDKFSKPDNLGYGAAHAQLVDPVTGQINELQIHTPQTFAAVNDFGGHYVYDYLFSKNAKPVLGADDDKEARKLIEYVRGVQADAHDAAMKGKPFGTQRYRLAMETNADSPEYGRWYVEEKVPGQPSGGGNRVAEADNPFKARSVMMELEERGAHVNKAPVTAVETAIPGTAGATTAPNAPVSMAETPDSRAPANVPRGNSTLNGPQGSEDVTFFGTRAVKTRYRVVDARDLRASNDPHTFERRGDYPEAIQGRVYHGAAGQGARESVVAGALGLDARRIVNPTRSIGGPPTLTGDGVVVAGNQRAMMQQRVYDLHPEKATELRAQVAADAQRAGLNPAELEGIERPVLVREIVDETVDQADMNQLRELNELSDKVTKKAKDPLREAMGRARQLKANSAALDHYATTSSPEEPLSDYLQGPNGLPFLNKLVDDKVILASELDGFRDAASGRLSKQGRQKLQEMMNAAAVGDAAIIDAAPAAIVGKLESATPRLVAAAQVEGWSLEKPLQEALELHTARVANGQKSIADALSQPDMLGREIAGEQGQALARFLESSSKGKVTDAMRSWSEAAEKAKLSDGSADMFGISAETADEAFERIFRGARRPEPAMVGGNRTGAIGNQAMAKLRTADAMLYTPESGYVEFVKGNKVIASGRFDAPTLRGIIGDDGFDRLISTPDELGVHRLEASDWKPSQGRAGKIGVAGDVSKDPYNYAAMKMLTSMAGTGIGGAAGGATGSRVGATPEERKRNAVLGFGVGALAGAVAPFAPEMMDEILELGAKLRTAGAPEPARLFQLHATPEIIRVKVSGQPSKEQIKQLFDAVRKHPKATFRYSVRDLEGREVGAGRSLGNFGAEVVWADSNRPLRQGAIGDYSAEAGAVGNQPAPKPPTRVERSPYKGEDFVYWPRNSRASREKASEYLNLARTGLDLTGEARVKQLIASGLDKGTIDKGYRSFADQDIRAAAAKRELLKKMVEDPKTLVGPEKLKNVSTSTIKAMWQITNDNTKVIEASARVMNNPLASADEIADAAKLHDRAYKQTEELLSTIVTETAQKAREFGALRNIAKQSTDPEVWLVQAKRVMGDRPMPDAVQAQIRKLARQAQEACL